MPSSSKADESSRAEASSSRREPAGRLSLSTKQKQKLQQHSESPEGTATHSSIAPPSSQPQGPSASADQTRRDRLPGKPDSVRATARLTDAEESSKASDKRDRLRKDCEGEASSSAVRTQLSRIDNNTQADMDERKFSQRSPAVSPTPSSSRSNATSQPNSINPQPSQAPAASTMQFATGPTPTGAEWGSAAASLTAQANEPTSSYNHTATLNGLTPHTPVQQLAAAQAAAVAAMATSSSAAFRANSLTGTSFAVPSSPASSSSSVSSTHPRSTAGQQGSFMFRQPFQSALSHSQQQQLHQHQHLHQHMTLERERFTASLTNCVIAFLSPILPTEEEYRIKEATRRQLERLTGKVSPGAKLLAFGSMANGFALKNSDMDLCCLLASKEQQGGSAPSPFNASELVERLGNVLREETDYTVMPLPKARIPIIKISRAPTAELPYEISCDIGFENRLALENTRLLLSYAMVDPPRLRTLVLFLKVWTKRRKLNSPYTGTLSSYGYTLMMIFFLMHVKRPAILPNLQRISPPANGKRQDANLNGHNIYFYDDVASLRKDWTSSSTENVGELLLDFFKYFSKEFGYSRDVISIRTETGVLSKDGKLWNAELCIEDPFQLGYNVARTVTKDGLYTIRGEFMRASRILTTRMDRVSAALAELCEEREDGLTRAPDPSNYQRRPAALPPYAAAHFNLAPYLASGAFDPRYLRELTRRLEAGGTMTSGFGGSFAFEEMARGLAQAQHNGTAIAFPPTTAMLAALSQNVGLSPRQSVMRAGLRYETPRRNQSVIVSPTTTSGADLGSLAVDAPTLSANRTANAEHQQPAAQAGESVRDNVVAEQGGEGSSIEARNGKHSDADIKLTAATPVPSRIISSARSEDGGASSRRSKRWNASNLPPANVADVSLADSESVDEVMSPRVDVEAAPQRLLHPDAALHSGSYGIGEAFAYGSEISFGSQRFQLYPQPTTNAKQRQNSTSGVDTASDGGRQTDVQARNTGPSRDLIVGGSHAAEPRTARSFSDGLSRSNSVPRPILNGTPAAPALSQPPSPRGLTAPRGIATVVDEVAVPSMLNHLPTHSRSSSISAQSNASVPVEKRRGKRQAGRGAEPTNVFSSATSSPAPITSGRPNAPSQQRLASHSASGSPYLTPTPWSFFPHPPASSHNVGDDDSRRMSFVHNVNGGGGFIGGDSSSPSGTTFSPAASRREDFVLDDEDAQTRLSDGTMDDSGRISAVASSLDDDGVSGERGALASLSSDVEAVQASDSNDDGDHDPTLRRRQVKASTGAVGEAAAAVLLPVEGKEHDVRSWAASQREHLDLQHHVHR